MQEDLLVPSDHLTQVNQYIAEMRTRVVRQKLVIRRLKAAKATDEPLELALDFLAGLEVGLEALHSHRRYALSCLTTDTP